VLRLRVWAEAEKRVKKIRPAVRGNRILLFYPQSGENPRVFFHLQPTAGILCEDAVVDFSAGDIYSIAQ
jgi:ABC-type cobalt transport system substrate-binding protein